MDKKGIFFGELYNKYGRDIYSKHLKIAVKTGEDFNSIGTEKEKYIKQLFSYFYTITNGIEELKQINIYLSIDEVPKYYLDNGLEEKDYYTYHVHYHHIKCVSLIDFTVILLNHSLQLGIPLPKCNLLSITENTRFKETEISKRLKQFNKEFQQLKSERNKIIHRNEFHSEDLKNLDGEISMVNLFSDSKELQEYFLKNKEKKLKKIIYKFLENIKLIEHHIGEILEALSDHVEMQIKYFEIREKLGSE